MTMDSSKTTVVCVLGMSRSGTSLTARVLHLAGVYLGPEDDLLGGDLAQLPDADRERARAANPEGFWEHYRMMRLNERILRRLGGSWREPPPLSPGWEDSPDLDEQREEARALLDETFSGRALWGWKDPRNCLTLPFWRSLIPQIRCVVCLRNPLDVAASLARRDGMGCGQALDLWATYLSAALANTSDLRRTLVSYESYFGGGWAVASRLARFVGSEGAFDDHERREALARAIDAGLWRNRTGPAETLSAGDLDARSATLYLLTELLERGDAGVRPESSLQEAVDLHAEHLLTLGVG